MRTTSASPRTGARDEQDPRVPDARLEADAAAVFDVMTELLRIYQFRDRDRANAHGVTVTQSYALGVILRRREVTAKELAYELALEKSTVSRLVDAMAESGMVERAGHPDDARSVLLRATPLGRRLYRAGRRDIVRENAAALRGLTRAQRATFIETLERFTEAARIRIRGEGSDVGSGEAQGTGRVRFTARPS
jgi:MarR family transcriptional regulator, 2-MHQ and catechol-resistance regulon repressor